MQSEIPISYINDFIFCPRSIYFHSLYGSLDTRLYHDRYQIEGRIAHQAIDNKTYSTRKTILQGVDVYSSRYGIYGKIDTYNYQTGLLTERKKKIKRIYRGYVFQIYAQFFGLTEMGYEVAQMKFYSMDDNRNHPVLLPTEDPYMLGQFEETLSQIKNFKLHSKFIANENKCLKCIYSNLCDYSLC